MAKIVNSKGKKSHGSRRMKRAREAAEASK